jgi:hypothetical protein
MWSRFLCSCEKYATNRIFFDGAFSLRCWIALPTFSRCSAPPQNGPIRPSIGTKRTHSSPSSASVL